MTRQIRTRETYFQILRDFWSEDWGDYCTVTYHILYDNRAEAEKVMHQLEAGSDPSWHDTANGSLSVVEVTM